MGPAESRKPKADITITERGYRDTCLGRVLQLKIFARGYPRLAWREVWEAFASAYPGKWALEIFPPADELVDSKAVYHLFVLEREPAGLNIKRE
jgi:hypothetical protein